MYNLESETASDLLASSETNLPLRWLGPSRSNEDDRQGELISALLLLKVVDPFCCYTATRVFPVGVSPDGKRSQPQPCYE